MPEPRPLALLLNLARTKADEALRRLGPLQAVQARACADLERLTRSREAYQHELSGLLQSGAPAAQLRDFQNFIRALDRDVNQQQAAGDQAHAALQQGRTDWLSSQQRLKALDILGDRARLADLGRVRVREQRAHDERAAWQSYRADAVHGR